MIKAVILDFGGVVFRNKPKEEWVGITEPFKVDSERWKKAGLGQIKDQVVFEEVAKNHQVTTHEVKEWLFSRREPNQELLNLLSRLKPEIKKAIINNGLQSIFRELLAKYELSVEFDALINSAEEGVRKPDPRIYLITCERIGVKPEECLMVDDDQANLDGAAKLGMQIHLFYGVEKLEEKLRFLSII